MCMIVYHGTDSKSADNILKNGINLSYSNPSVDNGKGFYTTPNLEFAYRRANSRTTKTLFFNDTYDVTPAVLQLTIDIESNLSDLNILRFDGCIDDWKEFVLLNRLGRQYIRKRHIVSSNHNLDQKYDIVIDETADTDISRIVDELKYGKLPLSYRAFLNRINKSNIPCWDKQISFHTEKAINCIKEITLIDNIYKEEDV